jgi:hypothetical protein
MVTEDVVITAITTRFGFDQEVFAGEGVHQDVDKSRASHHRARKAEICHAGSIASSTRHAASRKRKRQNYICDGVDNHVADNTSQTL